jgi:hypothetical protein
MTGSANPESGDSAELDAHSVVQHHRRHSGMRPLAQARNPSPPINRGDGFRAHRFAMPRNDGECFTAPTLAEKKFACAINAILPVQSPSPKIFRFASNPNHSHISVVPFHLRGVSRSSRTLERDAVDAAASGAQFVRGRMMQSRTAKSCGPGAPTQALKVAKTLTRLAGDGGNQRWSPGRARISRKTIAQGMPGRIRCTCGSCPCAFSLHRGPWVQRAPGIPCALIVEGGSNRQQLGRDPRREGESVSARLYVRDLYLRDCI